MNKDTWLQITATWKSSYLINHVITDPANNIIICMQLIMSHICESKVMNHNLDKEVRCIAQNWNKTSKWQPNSLTTLLRQPCKIHLNSIIPFLRITWQLNFKIIKIEIFRQSCLFNVVYRWENSEKFFWIKIQNSFLLFFWRHSLKIPKIIRNLKRRQRGNHQGIWFYFISSNRKNDIFLTCHTRHLTHRNLTFLGVFSILKS